MEHLPQRVGQASSIFPPIANRCRRQYDKGLFLEYPQRCGLPSLKADGTQGKTPSLTASGRRRLLEMPQAELESLMQNWLFFGLLHEVLQDLFHHDEFVVAARSQEENGEMETSIITTANLLARLEEWENRMKQENRLPALYEHLAECLGLAHACLSVEYPAFDNDLRFHLASVSELIGYAVSKACDVAWTKDARRNLLPLTWGLTPGDPFLRYLLLERSNCCPSQIRMLINEFGSSTQALAFVATCFQDDYLQPRHEACDEAKCQAGGLLTPHQIPRHVDESCKCDSLRIDEEQLAYCLRQGHLPLLRIRHEKDIDKLSVEVVTSTESTPYAAISHVCADGLGNSAATALPRCQIARLKVSVNNLDFEYVPTKVPIEIDASQLLLWCDTLCCPVVSKEAKNIALTQLYRTYNEAYVVLVLDRSLISHPQRTDRVGVEEACLRVATSRWMTRLWTLQEGALPARQNKLWFQLTNIALPLRSLTNRLHQISTTDIRWRGVSSSLSGRLGTFAHLFDILNIDDRRAEVKNVARGLAYRSLTVPSDEPLIIATLLALKIGRILACKPGKRMRLLWQMIATSASGIHKDILFHTAPRLQSIGFRWAPRSLLLQDNLHFAFPVPGEEENRAFLHTKRKGLVAELAGIRITIAKPADGVPEMYAGYQSLPKDDQQRYRLLMRDHHGCWYLLSNRRDINSVRVPDLEETHALITGLSSPWILYHGSYSTTPNPAKAHTSLLVDARSKPQYRYDDFTCVEQKSQVIFQRVPLDVNTACQAAYSLVPELALSAAAHALKALPTFAQDNPSHFALVQGIALEMQRLSNSPSVMDALHAVGISNEEWISKTVSEFLDRIYCGQYVQIKKSVPGNSKWCVN